MCISAARCSPKDSRRRRRQVQRSAIDAAYQSGVSHMFYTSLAFGGDCTVDSVADAMHAQLKTERYFQTFDVESTEK